MAAFRLPQDLAIEPVAAEPDVVDPVAVAWDEDGRLFVVEMGDYPIGPPGGRVKLLEDRDGDGRVDSSIVFADRLPFPTSVLPWRGGLLVSAAPDILYLKDTDGDGRADSRRVLFTGFGEGNQQLRVNGLAWGIDNWVYAANGRSDGEIRPASSQAGVQPVSVRHRDFRFRPADGRFEATSGFTQHGHGFDDWGQRFIGWNTVHIRHVVLDQHHLDRNPHAPAMPAAEEIADHGSTCRIFPASPTTQRFNAEPPGYMNASCGLTVYRGDLLPAAYRGNAFVCEPLSNIVHRDVLEPAGATFVARRGAGEADREFLASTDTWFRPVNLATGPDGALYVVDFYRAWVEHPQYVRDETARKTVDWREGSDRGRIWRIVPNRQKPDQKPVFSEKTGFSARAPKLSAATSAELVRLLEHPNGWHRDTAQRLLVERQDREAVAALVKIGGESPSPVARVHALRTLDGLGALDDTVLVQALGDRHARVREHAVQLAEPRLARSAQLTSLVSDLDGDADPRVRFQVACTLGQAAATSRTVAALVQIAARDAGDPWTRRAVRCADPQFAGPFVTASIAEVSDTSVPPTEEQLGLLTGAAAVVGARNDEGVHELISSVAKLPARRSRLWDIAVWTGLERGRQRAGHAVPDWSLAKAPTLPNKNRSTTFTDAVERVARSDQQPQYARIAAVRLFAVVHFHDAALVIPRFLDSKYDQAIQVTAVQSLGEHSSPEVVDLLLAKWEGSTPAVRRAIVDAVLGRRERVPKFVEALEQKRIVPADLDAAQTDLLRRLGGDELRPRLDALLEKRATADRRQVIESFQPALALAGDRQRGVAVFTKHCMTCHAIQGKGQRVGPDLASVARHPPAELLADILDPNRSVATDALNYVVATRDGRVLSGVIAAESVTAITLRRAEGIEESVARSEIEELRSTGKSLMPDGLEQGVTHQDMADLLEFLRAGEPPP